MKTPAEWDARCADCNGEDEVAARLEARDAEHAAESKAREKALREELEGMRERERLLNGHCADRNALAQENDRLKGELAEARRLLTEAKTRPLTLRELDAFLAAPSPAESPTFDQLVERVGSLPTTQLAGAAESTGEAFMASLPIATRTYVPAAPPDDIRDRLTFEQFSDINRRRCESYNGFGESLQPSSKYTEAHWALSIASEAGEVADAILGWSGLKRSKADKTKEDVGRELADVVTYCDLLASKLGFRLSHLIVAKFNEINQRCGFGRRFAIDPHVTPPAPQEQAGHAFVEGPAFAPRYCSFWADNKFCCKLADDPIHTGAKP